MSFFCSPPLPSPPLLHLSCPRLCASRSAALLELALLGPEQSVVGTTTEEEEEKSSKDEELWFHGPSLTRFFKFFRDETSADFGGVANFLKEGEEDGFAVRAFLHNILWCITSYHRCSFPHLRGTGTPSTTPLPPPQTRRLHPDCRSPFARSASIRPDAILLWLRARERRHTHTTTGSSSSSAAAAAAGPRCSTATNSMTDWGLGPLKTTTEGSYLALTAGLLMTPEDQVAEVFSKSLRLMQPGGSWEDDAPTLNKHWKALHAYFRDPNATAQLWSESGYDRQQQQQQRTNAAAAAEEEDFGGLSAAPIDRSFARIDAEVEKLFTKQSSGNPQLQRGNAYERIV
eukprot:GHVU01193586.1.p1 GENE.GHVU01193586.1~~GHVU01193586.1.p1  ORF type:complete len:344 (+),score=57.84 GHVU01193586.1:221-1252(+)